VNAVGESWPLAEVLAWEQGRPADTLRRVGLSDAEMASLLALADSGPSHGPWRARRKPAVVPPPP
jgi:hypothetical protein